MTHIKTTKVYRMNEEAVANKKSIIIHQGGSRSSKTYNILIWLIVHSLVDWQKETIDIFRKTFPSLRTSVMHDFFKILKENGLYDEENHNKTESTYSIGTNLFRFGSVDQETRVRGAGRSYLFLNEANEFNEDEFKQLNQRTTKLTIIDYNPSDEFHWIYDKLIPREDCAFYQTTYKDNPFIPERVRKEIEEYKNLDENYWRIYGLGERGISETTIYTHWKFYEKEFKEAEGEELFGLDFGFNHPTALIKVKYCEPAREIIAQQLIYKSGHTTETLIEEMKNLVKEGKIKYSDKIIADNSRPEMISALYKEGFNIHPSKKGDGSVLRGINFIKINKLFVTKDSIDLIKELKSYKWKVDKNGIRQDDPVGINDDCCDALRYSLEDKSRNKKELGTIAL